MPGLKERTSVARHAALQVVEDEKLRERILAVLAAGAAARQRSKRSSGSVAHQLATDWRLRLQLVELGEQLRAVARRAQVLRKKEKPSHGLRNFVLFTAGVGMVAAAVSGARRHSRSGSPEGSVELASPELSPDGAAPGDVS